MEAQIEWLDEQFPDGRYRDVIGLCKVASLEGEDGIVDQNYSLNAGRYVGVVIEDDGLSESEYRNEVLEISSCLDKLNEDAAVLEKKIADNIQKLIGE